MRIRAALLCAALIAAPLQAQAQASAATADDARAVIATVLAHQASIRGPEGGAETCVTQALTGPPVAPGAAAEDDRMAPDHAVRIYFQWHAPDAPAPVRAPRPEPAPGQRRSRPRPAPPPPPPAPLAAVEAERLNTLRTEAARAPSPALAAIDPAQIPAPLHLQRRDDDCAMLTLSAPAFAGDAAFVELAYACGTVCGNGALYALQRREGRWELVGIADIWIR
jgi:hypothetical protein